jgi:hypothetical protein
MVAEVGRVLEVVPLSRPFNFDQGVDAFLGVCTELRI